MNPLNNQIVGERVRIAELEQIYARFGSRPQLFSWVISAFEILEPDQTWRGIWLLRRLARAREFSEQEMAALVQAVDIAGHWTARLNLCQLLATTGVPASVREELFPFLRESFADHRQIIRAWAISALVTFMEDPDFKSEIAAMRRKAGKETGKAMQARLRRLNRSITSRKK